MGVEDLVFKYQGNTIYEPQSLSTAIDISITNFGTDDVTDIGIYIVSGTTLGDVDYPADYPPETDYQDLIKWGEETTQGVEANGGLILSLPQNDGSTLVSYVTRQAGSTAGNKFRLADIPAGSSITITVEPEAAPSVSARRLFIDLRIEGY